MELEELIEELRQVEEVTLMELLELSSDDLVDAFIDRIEERAVRLRKKLDDDKI